MSLKSKTYDPDFDFDRIIVFLRETYLETKILTNCFPNRFENDKNNYPAGIHIWEEVDLENNVKIVGLTLPESKNIYSIQCHPNYFHIIPEMVNWIINHTKSVKNDLNKKENLSIVCLDQFVPLERILQDQGFIKDKNYGYLRFRNINKPVHEHKDPGGFFVRSIIGKEEYGLYAKGVRDTFGHGEFFNAELVQELNSNSYYNHDLDLFIEAPNGDIAAFCTFRMDPETRITELEPMGTLPNYRKLGLGKLFLAEGFKRLKKYKPSLLYIGGAADTPEANRLYDSVGFTEKRRIYLWEIEI